MFHYLPYFIRIRPSGRPKNVDFHTTYRILSRFNSIVGEEIKSIEFIGPFREPPRRTYLFSGESPESVGVRGERAVDIVTMDYLKQTGKEKKDLINKISNWYKLCGISEKLKIRSLSDRHYEIVLSHIKSKTEESLADVGFGCSQVLPVLVAGYNSENGDILAVQEPEIHLHPKAQAELGSFFYELSKKGVQSIIETHSEHLMLRIQAHIADKNSDLRPEDVCVYYVYAENGIRNIKKIELKDDGFFKDKWPDGFFPERYMEVKKIAKGSMHVGD